MSEYTRTYDSSDTGYEPENKPVETRSENNVETRPNLASAPISTDPGSAHEVTEKRQRSRKVWLWSLLAIAVAGGGLVGWRVVSAQNNPAVAQAPPPLMVEVQDIESSSVQSTGEFVGKLEAQERVSLQPQVAGRIEQVLVEKGDFVTQGTAIVALSLDQTASDVTSAVAAVNSNRAAVATAEAELQATEADRVKAAGDVRLQQLEFERTQYLVSKGAQTQQQLDITQNNLDTAIATLAAADKQISAGRAGVEQAQSNVEQAQAQAASTQVNLNQKQVVSPIDGVVGDFSFKAGDYASIGQTLTTITKNDAFDMRISVPANNTSQLRLGLPVELLDTSTSTQLTRGSINFVSPQVSSDAQSILVTARFSNANSKLRDGQSVRARIIWSQQPGILIPNQAVNRIGGQSFVFVIEENQTQGQPAFVVRQKPVKLGEVQNDFYPVLEGVEVGDRVATSNILKLRDGAPVQPQSQESSQSQEP
jgi:RND family efflux transporter MFP subunit